MKTCTSVILSHDDSTHSEVSHILMVMSHDIRGSLLTMAAALKLLDRDYYGKMEKEVKNTLADLYGRILKLIRTSEDFLCNASSLNGGLEIGREVLDLRKDIIEPLLEEFSTDIEKHNIMLNNRLTASSAKQIPIKASKILLETVFRNLFSNAIKYGGKGCTIDFGFEDHGSYYRLNVYNSGTPVPVEQHHKLFTKFGRIKNNENSGPDGMGLGLYLIKEILQAHGGDIWYESEPGGSNFIFIIPGKNPKRMNFIMSDPFPIP